MTGFEDPTFWALWVGIVLLFVAMPIRGVPGIALSGAGVVLVWVGAGMSATKIIILAAFMVAITAGFAAWLNRLE